MSLAISLTSVKKRYGTLLALDDLNLEIEKGTICGLLGPNGAGKTTTLRLLLGFLKADSGTLSGLGLDCWKESLKLRRVTGFLKADQAYPPWLTARKALEIAAEVRRTKLDTGSDEMARRLELDLDKPARKMSRGNLQKIGLVLALAHHPELLVFDEPTSGLDPLVQEVFVALVKEAQDRGTTVLLSSHTFAEVDKLCQQVVVVRHGKTVASEPIASFRERAYRRVRIQFVDAPPDRLPEKLEDPQRRETTVLGLWRGRTAELVHWCSQQQLSDLEISAPQLDDAFMDFYR